MEMFPPIVGSSDLYKSFKLSFNHFINFFKIPSVFDFFLIEYTQHILVWSLCN